jgi:hypothetical protein
MHAILNNKLSMGFEFCAINEAREKMYLMITNISNATIH